MRCGHMLGLMGGLRGRITLMADFSPLMVVPVRSYFLLDNDTSIGSIIQGHRVGDLLRLKLLI